MHGQFYLDTCSYQISYHKLDKNNRINVFTLLSSQILPKNGSLTCGKQRFRLLHDNRNCDDIYVYIGVLLLILCIDVNIIYYYAYTNLYKTVYISVLLALM